MGDTEWSIAFYNKFLEAYENADPVYDSWKKDAQRQLGQLVKSPEDISSGEDNL